MTPTLYLTRNGLLEPLGQSQVLGYLRGLSRDYRITLVTFEKPADMDDAAAMARARAECERLGISWLPQRFRARPKLIAPAFAMLRMLRLALREVRAGNAGLVHARSYVPAAVALAVKRLTGVPFIFDMRALWPEELITAGRLRRGSLLHRSIAAAERACLREAAAVVSLTRAAADHLTAAMPGLADRIAVIPTCADLDRFHPAAAPPEGPPVWSCIGTILSGWFRADMLRAFFAAVAARDATARFEIVTRDDPARVAALFAGLPEVVERLRIYAARPEEVAEALRGHHVSAMFYAGGATSELGRAPTRLAEILGSGLPVIANRGVGDVARIVGDHRVGVLADGPAPAQMAAALDALDALMADPDLPARCRRAAEEVFSLERGVAAYRAIYADLAGNEARSAAERPA